MSCTPIPQEYKDYLDSIPSKWRDQILAFLIKVKEEGSLTTCESLKACETLTSLSEFTIEGTQVCIEFQDEAGVKTKRCFDVSNMLNNALYDVDPKCLTTVENWRNMTLTQKFQAIVDKICSI